MSIGLGDIVAAGIRPFVAGADYLFGTDLQHCQGCKDRPYFSVRTLNNFGEIVVNWFTNEGDKMTEETENKMEWLIVVKVTAKDDVSDAISKVKVIDGKIAAVNPGPRVQVGGGRPMVTTGGPTQ